MAIRYDKKLNQEIYRTVYEYNKKVRSLSKTDTTIKIPNLITTKDLKSKDPTNPMYSYNRADLKRKLKQMQRFLKPGQETVIVTPAKQVFSKWEFHNLQVQRSTALKRIKKQIQELEQMKATYAGRPMKYNYAQMGSQQYQNLLQKLQYLETHQLGELKGETLTYYRKFLTANNRPNRDKEWKNNFLDIMLNIGYEYGYQLTGNSKLAQIRERLSQLSTQQFIKAFNEERLLKDMTYYYKILNETLFDKDLVEDDVSQLLDTLYENLDEIIKNAKS